MKSEPVFKEETRLSSGEMKYRWWKEFRKFKLLETNTNRWVQAEANFSKSDACREKLMEGDIVSWWAVTASEVRTKRGAEQAEQPVIPSSHWHFNEAPSVEQPKSGLRWQRLHLRSRWGNKVRVSCLVRALNPSLIFKSSEVHSNHRIQSKPATDSAHPSTLASRNARRVCSVLGGISIFK